MKKTIALLTAAALMVGFTGCEKKEPEPSGATLEVSLDHSYSAKQLPVDESLTILNFDPFGEKILLNGFQEEEETLINFVGLLDPDTGEFVRKDMGDYYPLGMDDCGDTLDIMFGCNNDDGTDAHLMLVTFDNSLSEIHSEEVTAAWGDYVPEIGSWARDAQGNEYASKADTVICMASNGTIENIDGSEGAAQLYKGRDGNVYGISPNVSQSIDVYDPNSLTSKTIDIELPSYYVDTHAKIVRGSTQYDYLCYNNDYLYGVSIPDGSVKEIVNWEDSDFDAQKAILLPDGRAFLTENDSGWLLTERTQEEIDSIQLISMATLFPSLQLTELVHLYNRQAQGGHITVKSYAVESTDDLGRDGLEKDLLNGIIPDILAADADYQKLSNKGLFEDISVWMENDPDFHEEDYIMNFFDTLRYKGKLERISFGFQINCLEAKSEYVNTRMTLSELMALDLPENMVLLGGMQRDSSYFEYLMYSQLGEFVDYENSKCSFDNPEFVQLLELLRTVQESKEVRDESAYTDNRALLRSDRISGLEPYHYTVQTIFGGADVKLTGIPVSEKGNGGEFLPMDSISMLADSKYKEQIWDFFKFCMNQNNQMSIKQYSTGFPVRLDALEKMIEFDQQDSSPFFEEVGAATAEEADELLSYIKGITNCTFSDISIQGIVSEEAGKYFAGDCAAEDAAKMIQSRVSLYLAEQS